MAQRKEMRRYGPQTSPERTKVWVEPPRKYHYRQEQQQQQQQQEGRKVPVVYYLCKNRHLEHPHFIEVPLSSNDGLYLRDVINRLNVLRGKKMAGMYSWSCKRSYKNGFVWHDLADDDLIPPVHGNEYVLKGSELLDRSPQDRHHDALGNPKNPQDSPISSKPDVASSSSSPIAIIKDAEKVSSPSPRLMPRLEPLRARLAPSSREYESSPSTVRSGSSEEFSPVPIGKTALLPRLGSPSATEYRNFRNATVQDVSTQTEDARSTTDAVNTRVIGISTDEGPFDVEYKESASKFIPQPKLVPDIVVEERSPPLASSSTSSSCAKSSTLESLIRDEISKRGSFRTMEEEVFIPARAKIKVTSMLMQLISCGSISVKDHYNLGFVPTYRARFNSVKFPSPLISNSAVLCELDYLSESQRVLGLREHEKDYFTVCTTGAKRYSEMVDGISTLKRSSSFDGVRSSSIPSCKRDNEKAVDAIQSRCLPCTMNVASCKHSKNDIKERAMSPVEDIRIVSAGSASCRSSPLSSSKIGSKRIIDSSSVQDSSLSFESFREEKEKVIKIKERLTSGARVIIQSRSPCQDEDRLE